MGPTGSGHVRIQTDDSTGEIFQLEARSRSRSSGCLQLGPEQHIREGLCQPPMEPSQQSAEQSPATACHTSSGGSSMEEPAMVPYSTGNAGRLPNPPPSQKPRLHALNRVTLNQIRIRIGSVHTCSCEASLAHESSLTTCATVAEGLDYFAMNTDNFAMQQIIHLETAPAVYTHLLQN